MTLQSSGPISASDINLELGRASDAPFNIGGAEERALAGVPSGPISFSDFYGKSNVVSIPVNINTATIVATDTSGLGFAVAQVGVQTNGTLSRSNAFNYLWVASADQSGLDSSLYRCRLTKTSGNADEGQLFLNTWRTLEQARFYSITNTDQGTTVNFVGELRIEEIADSNNFDTVTINLTATAEGEEPPF